jgi:hypothetical protein
VIITDSLSTLKAIKGNNHTKNPKTMKLREMMDRLRKQITLLWVTGHIGKPGNEQADKEAKAVLDDDLEQKEEYPPRPRKLLDSGNGEEQKRTMEERKQQLERAKDRTQIRRKHKRNGEKRAGGNLQTKNGIHQSYPSWTSNEWDHQPKVPFLRHQTYSRPCPMGLQRNRKNQKRDEGDTRRMEKRRKRHAKDSRI